MSDARIPAALRAALAADPRPVRPIAPSPAALSRTALAALLALAATHSVFVLRPDHGDVGGGLLWGGSLAEALLGLALVVLALREATPGQRPPAGLLPAAAGLGVVGHLALAALTRGRSFVEVEAGTELATGALCAALELALGLAIGAGAILLLRLGISGRPAATALALGLGAALLADAAWRTICPYTEASHLLGGHGAGMVAAALGLGLLGQRWLRGGRRDRSGARGHSVGGRTDS